MINVKHLRIKYITNKRGKKTEVVLPLKEFEQILEDLEDLAVAAERRDEETITHSELIKDLKKNGKSQLLKN